MYSRVTITRSKPWRLRSSRMCSIHGLLTIEIMGFGWLLVSGRSLVPFPPAMITAFINPPSAMSCSSYGPWLSLLPSKKFPQKPLLATCPAQLSLATGHRLLIRRTAYERAHEVTHREDARDPVHVHHHYVLKTSLGHRLGRLA